MNNVYRSRSRASVDKIVAVTTSGPSAKIKCFVLMPRVLRVCQAYQYNNAANYDLVLYGIKLQHNNNYVFI